LKFYIIFYYIYKMNNKLFEHNEFANVPNAHTFMGSSNQGILKGYGSCSDGKGVVHATGIVGSQKGGGHGFKGSVKDVPYIPDNVAYSGCTTSKTNQTGGSKSALSGSQIAASESVYPGYGYTTGDDNTLFLGSGYPRITRTKGGTKKKRKKRKNMRKKGKRTRGGGKSLLSGSTIGASESIYPGYGYTTGVDNKLFSGSGYPKITLMKGGAKGRNNKKGRKTRGRKTRGGMKKLSFSPLKSVPIKLGQSIDPGYGYTTGAENELFYGSGYPEITPNTGCKKGGTKSRKGRKNNKRNKKLKTQRGGSYKQYLGGVPLTYSMEIPPNGPQNGQLAMPPPYTVLNNCQDNYNHYMQK
jgi:hypothetical protein